jgi:hypothetical protein
MKIPFVIFLLLLLSGCFTPLVQYTKPENAKYAHITLPEPESVYFKNEKQRNQPIYIAKIRSLSFLNRSNRLTDLDNTFYLRDGWYQAIIFCHRTSLSNGENPDKSEQISFIHGPFRQITFRVKQAHNYALDCEPYNKGQEETYSLTDTKTGEAKTLSVTWGDW